MSKKIIAAMQALILISFFAPFLLVIFLSSTMLHLGTPHALGLYDVICLLSIHTLMVVWILIQGDSATGGPMNDLIRSLPIDEAILARVEYAVLLVANNMVWIFFGIAALMAPYRTFSHLQAINFWLIIIAVSTLGMLLQVGVIRVNRQAAGWAVVLDLLFIITMALPKPLYQLPALVGLIVASVWMSLTPRTIVYGNAYRWRISINANRLYALVFIDPIVAMNFRWLLTDGLLSLGLRVSVIVMALAVPILVARDSVVQSVVHAAIVAGIGVASLATAGLYRTFSQFHIDASTYLNALPLSKMALAIRDFFTVVIVNLLFATPYVVGFYSYGYIAMADVGLLLISHILLLAAYKLAQAYFDMQSVLANTGVTVSWIVLTSSFIG